MLIFAMIAQALAMIGEHDEQSILRRRFLFNCADEAAKLLIHVGNFRVVGIARILPLKFCGRRNVGLMGIVKMQPDKKRLRRLIRSVRSAMPERDRR